MLDIALSAPLGEPPRPEPTRATLLAWLRLNLSVVLFIAGVLTGAATTLITGTRALSDAQHQLNSATVADAKFHDDMIDVDHRLNLARDAATELRRLQDAEVSALRERVGVLDAQVKFFGDHSPVPQPLGPVVGRRS